MVFLKSVGIWMVFTLAPPLLLYLYVRPQFRGMEYIMFFLPSVLIPAIGCAVLWLPGLRLDTAAKGMIAGILSGLLLPILGGFAWMRLFPGFESQPAIFVGSVVLAAPSALGGSFAGVLRGRSFAELS